MRVYFTLLRRELGSYFMSLTGYVLIASVLLMLGLSLVDMLGKLNADPTEWPLTEIFYYSFYFWMILLLTAPIITMRTFALEKFSGTYETLMTAPVSDLQVVLAKFSGALVVFLITWIPLLIYLAILQHYTDVVTPAVSSALIGSTLLGIFLIGSVYMSLGCFASALTSSQIIAAAVSYGLGLAFFLASLRATVSMPGSTWKDKLFAHISMTDHMREFSHGEIDSRWVIYLVSLTIFFLFLTLRVVESRRWK
jgi:ABC-2 type transport system permease protein